MTQRIGVGVNSVSRSIHGSNSGSANINIDAVRDFYRFQQLYSVVILSLNQYLSYFNSGQTAQLTQLLTIAKQNKILIDINNKNLYYNNTITTLHNFVYDKNLFDYYKKLTYNILTGLEAILEQDASMNSLNEQIATLTIKAAILDSSPAIINEYITNRKLDILAFNTDTVYDTDIILREWYAEYLFQYGAPSNGVFDKDKLATIVNNLILSGVITLQDFINS